MLRAARQYFHTTLLTLSTTVGTNMQILQEQCDMLLVLPSHHQTTLAKIMHLPAFWLYRAKTGLKKSNYILSHVEFSPRRVAAILAGKHFDVAILEYWHAYHSMDGFRTIGTTRILDMNDVLWKARERALRASSLSPAKQHRLVEQYRRSEQSAWNSFDRVIAINALERQLVQSTVNPGVQVDYLPMGIDLSEWPFQSSQNTTDQRRVGFYGGLGSEVNIRAALVCLEQIMPRVWAVDPNVEFWLIGSGPVASLAEEARKDPRIHITGYLENVAAILARMDAVFCPWEGVFGFRSRVIELMALGVPVIASSDAVAGMELQPDSLLIANTPADMAQRYLMLLQHPEYARQIRITARAQVEQNFSYASTYERYFSMLTPRLSQSSQP